MLLGLVVIGTTGAGINNKLYHKRGVSGGPLGGDIFVRGNSSPDVRTPPQGVASAVIRAPKVGWSAAVTTIYGGGRDIRRDKGWGGLI